MTSALIVGALMGLGAWCVVISLQTRRPSLAAVLANLEGVAPGRSGRVRFDDLAATLPLRPRPAAAADLALLGRNGASWATERLMAAAGAGVAGFLWVGIVGSVLSLPLWVRLAFVVALMAAGAALARS